ncbi:ATP-binding protein [Flavobacterium frigidarium]|uniref:ATP-binding protein n=1 Tax=Flavobacterium frigidarium TaxID=99286 RepID=UPI00047CD80E|nr:ATP-binding protein [Flavobacterium frigidarium]
MKYFLVFLLHFSILLHSQTNVNLDSTLFYSNLAAKNSTEDNYKSAIYYTQKAINYSEQSKDKYNQALQTFLLGKLYFELNKNEDAENFLNESIALFKKQAASIPYSDAYYFLGLAKIRKKDYTSAERFLDKSLKIRRALKIPQHDLDDAITVQKGIIFRSIGRPETAANLFNSIISKDISAEKITLKAEAYYQMGLIELANNRYNFALNYFSKAFEKNSESENIAQKSEIAFALSTVYEKLLEKNKAYSFLKLHLNLKESLRIADNQKLRIDDYDQFKESQQLKAIERTNKEQAEDERNNKFSKLINILAIALISILSLLSLSLYKNNVIRTKTNLLLKDKNKELILEKEKTEKASKARSEFLSTVSHELRTPLNAINGITHLLLEENPKKSQLHYLASLKFSGNYLATFINEILEINKIESDKIDVEHIPFNLKELLTDIKSSLNGLAIKNNNDFKVLLDEKIPETLLSDPTKLSQIFMNLINNALKFTQNGSVIISTTANLISDNVVAVYFNITDTGIGIAEDKYETVFESFSQGSVEINRKYGGTGLGLTIVKKLVSVLGGEIQLKSTLGEGSTFNFQLEFEIDKNLAGNNTHLLVADHSILDGKKILVVEDNKINQMITVKMLQNKGANCTVIDNGEEAITNIANNHYNIVLMDVHLPGINGTIATQEIRKFNTSIPIIAITAISLDENREMLLSYGMNDVVTKPFSPENFYNVISKNLVLTSS